MKKFIKSWMLLFAIVVISVFVIISAINWQWESTFFIFQLLITTFIIRLGQLLTNKISEKLSFFKYFIDFAMALFVVLLLGWIWDWYNWEWHNIKGAWFIGATIIPVFFAAVFLDLIKVRRDVEIINEQIKKRRQQQGNEKIKNINGLDDKPQFLQNEEGN